MTYSYRDTGGYTGSTPTDGPNHPDRADRVSVPTSDFPGWASGQK